MKFVWMSIIQTKKSEGSRTQNLSPGLLSQKDGPACGGNEGKQAFWQVSPWKVLKVHLQPLAERKHTQNREIEIQSDTHHIFKMQ